MKNENLKIEDLFKQSFDGYKIEPPENLWLKINNRLNFKQFFKADFKSFNIYYSSLIIGLIGGIAYLLLNSNTQNPITPQNNLVQKENSTLIEKPVETNDKVKIYEIKSSPINTDIKQSKNVSIFTSKQIEIQEDNKITEVPLEIKKIDALLQIDKDSANQINTIVPYKPKPLFSITCKEGCVPFELSLNNFSQEANNYFWTFGDGGKSKEKSPTHVYNYPGIYRIQLRAEGDGGIAYSVIDSIVVHDKPIIKVNWPSDTEFLVGEKITVPIDAKSASRLEFDFGDGIKSSKKLADHAYKLPGQYAITLKSWTEAGCFDSVKIADISIIKNDNKIIFPNAFCPSPDGPSSGNYYERESKLDIFHPITKNQIRDYKLVIYSSTGTIVFETNDISIGWDGYYENRLMPEGVYPYISTGKYEGGKDFLIKGNITVIYRR